MSSRRGACGAGLALCMYIQLKFLNNGMRHFDVLFVLPIYQAFWITGATINGILFFEEYNNFTDMQYIMFPVGCVMTIAGVAALALKFQQPPRTTRREPKYKPDAGPLGSVTAPLG